MNPHVLQHFRQLRRLSRAELGRAAGVTGQQIGRYEDGVNEPSVSVAIKIAAALDVDLSVLVNGSDRSMVGSAGEARPQDAPAGTAGARSLNTEDSDAHP